MRSGGIPPLILIPSTSLEVSGHSPASLPPGKESLVAIKQEVGWIPVLSRHFQKQLNLLLLPGIEPRFLGSPPRSLTISNIILNNVRQHNYFITQGNYKDYMFRLQISHLQAYFCHLSHKMLRTLWDPIMFTSMEYIKLNCMRHC